MITRDRVPSKSELHAAISIGVGGRDDEDPSQVSTPKLSFIELPSQGAIPKDLDARALVQQVNGSLH